MRLDNKTFKIGTLRRRRELGRISNFKWLEAALNLVEIKNPLGYVQTNPQADAWWVPLFIFLEKSVFFLNTLLNTDKILQDIPEDFISEMKEAFKLFDKVKLKKLSLLAERVLCILKLLRKAPAFLAPKRFLSC